VALMLGMSAAQAEMIRLAAPLHDLGKVAIPDGILLKPGKLLPDEFAIVQQHTVIGVRILSGSRSRLLQMAEEIALTHHERWDGTGYPNGLAGEEIPLSGRIIAVVDVFDALTNRRPYKEAWSVNRAIEEIRALSGSHFDARVVHAFLEVLAAERADESVPLAA
jgi:putative two-component system response regulator